MAPADVDLCDGLVVLLPRQTRCSPCGFFSSAVLKIEAGRTVFAFLNFCFVFKIWLLTVHVYKIERLFGEKAVKNWKEVEYQKS